MSSPPTPPKMYHDCSKGDDKVCTDLSSASCCAHYEMVKEPTTADTSVIEVFKQLGFPQTVKEGVKYVCTDMASMKSFETN